MQVLHIWPNNIYEQRYVVNFVFFINFKVYITMDQIVDFEKLVCHVCIYRFSWFFFAPKKNSLIPAPELITYSQNCLLSRDYNEFLNVEQCKWYIVHVVKYFVKWCLTMLLIFENFYYSFRWKWKRCHWCCCYRLFWFCECLKSAEFKKKGEILQSTTFYFCLFSTKIL